jgi:hypothetical protein
VIRKRVMVVILKTISRLQRSGISIGSYLGGWPRLLHFAPLALKAD